MRQGAAAAVRALEEHAVWLEERILPAARGDYALGEALYNDTLREDHLVSYDVEPAVATGWWVLEETEHALEKLARTIDSCASASEILDRAKQDHPQPGQVVAAYRQAMDEARAFLEQERWVTLPPDAPIRVVPTPPFLRTMIPKAALISAPPFSETSDAVFIVTPVDDATPADQTSTLLERHLRANIRSTAVHEAFPGHHVQFSIANRCASPIRRIAAHLSTQFAEGWALYCEEMMESAGFPFSPIERLARLDFERMRAARVIADGLLHTGEMTIDHAIALFTDRLRKEPGFAMAEVLRFTTMPTQAQSYLMGKLELLRIMEAYRKNSPGASTCELHDRMLAAGHLPPSLLSRELLLRSSSGDSRKPDPGQVRA